MSGEPSSFSVGADQASDADAVDPVAGDFVTSIVNGASAVFSASGTGRRCSRQLTRRWIEGGPRGLAADLEHEHVAVRVVHIRSEGIRNVHDGGRMRFATDDRGVVGARAGRGRAGLDTIRGRGEMRSATAGGQRDAGATNEAGDGNTSRVPGRLVQAADWQN